LNFYHCIPYAWIVGKKNLGKVYIFSMGGG